MFFFKKTVPYDNFFTGRDDEIRQITQWLQKDFPESQINIIGAEGIGKTTFASKIAHHCFEISKSFEHRDQSGLSFDAFVWITAKEQYLSGDAIYPNTRVSPALDQIIPKIIKTIDPRRYQTRPDLKKQYDIAIELLTNYRTLLIVDDMETMQDDQAMAFLNDLPSHGKAITTSRRRLQAFHLIQLRKFSKEECYDLLNEYSNKSNYHLDAKQLDYLIMQTRRIPLSMILAFLQIKEKRWDSATFFTNMDEEVYGDVIEYLVAQSFEHISEFSRQILASLSLVPITVSGSMLSDWVGISYHDTENAFDELLRYGLIFQINMNDTVKSQITTSPTLKREYGVHPLARGFMDNKTDYINNALRERITNRVCKMVEDRSDKDNIDWPSIEAAIFISQNSDLLSWAIEDSFDRGDYYYVTNLMRYLGHALGVHDQNNLRLRLGHLAVRSAKKTNSNKEEARHWITNISWVYFIWRDFYECEKAITNGLESLELTHDENLKGIAIRNLALVRKELGDPEEAELLLSEAKRIFIKTKNMHFLAITYGSIGSLKSIQKDFISAEKHLLEAIRIVRSAKNSEELFAVFLLKIAKLMRNADKSSEAKNYNEQALQILKKLGKQET